MANFNPSAGAVFGALESLTNFGLTIYGKLDQADMITQYNAGQELLRRGTNDFFLQLQSEPYDATNPGGLTDEQAKQQQMLATLGLRETPYDPADPNVYVNKWAQAEQDLWEQVDKTVTNPGAKKELYNWWLQQRDAAEAQVAQIQFTAHGNAVIGTATKTSNGLMSDVATGRISADDAKTRIEQIWTPLERTNIIRPEELEDIVSKSAHQIDMISVQQGAFQAMQVPQGQRPNFDAAYAWLGDPANQAGLTDVEVQTVYNKVKQAEVAQDYQDTQANGKITDKLGDIIVSVDVGGADIKKSNEEYGKLLMQFQGKDAGEMQYKWAARYDALMAELDRRAKGLENRTSDETTMNNLSSKAYRLNPQDSNAVQAFWKEIDVAAGVGGDPSKALITYQDANHLREISQQKIDTAMATFLERLNYEIKEPEDRADMRIQLQEYEKYYISQHEGARPGTDDLMNIYDSVKKLQDQKIVVTALNKYITSTYGYQSAATSGYYQMGQWATIMQDAQNGIPAQGGTPEKLSTLDAAVAGGDLEALKIAEQLHLTIYNEFVNKKIGVFSAWDITKAIPVIKAEDGKLWKPFYDHAKRTTFWMYSADNGKTWVTKR
jgi:hypothetical protein